MLHEYKKPSLKDKLVAKHKDLQREEQSVLGELKAVGRAIKRAVKKRR